jgi:hypothetical protein
MPHIEIMKFWQNHWYLLNRLFLNMLQGTQNAHFLKSLILNFPVLQQLYSNYLIDKECSLLLHNFMSQHLREG